MSQIEAVKEVTVIKQPDLSAIPAVDCGVLMAIRVVDDASCELAARHGKLLKEIISQIETEFAYPKNSAFKLHRWLCDAEKKAVEPLGAALAHLEKQVAAWLPKREAVRVEREQSLKEAQEELDPWERQEVLVPATPPPAGVKDSWKPWSYELKDLHALLVALIPDDDGVLMAEFCNSETPAFLLNPAFWTPKAREMQADLHKKYPGVYGRRDKKKAI